MVQPPESKYFVLAGQTKRYIKTKLEAHIFWEEYLKTISIARNFSPFVLTVVTDSPEVDEVPLDLRPFVFCIEGKKLESFHGPMISQRRKHAGQSMVK